MGGGNPDTPEAGAGSQKPAPTPTVRNAETKHVLLSKGTIVIHDMLSRRSQM